MARVRLNGIKAGWVSLLMLLPFFLVAAASPATPSSRIQAFAGAPPSRGADGYAITSVAWDQVPAFTRSPARYGSGAVAEIVFSVTSVGTDDQGNAYGGSVTCDESVAIFRAGERLSRWRTSADTNLGAGYSYSLRFRCPRKPGNYVLKLRVRHAASGCLTTTSLRFRIGLRGGALREVRGLGRDAPRETRHQNL